MSHALSRTSPKGEAFVGTCMKCGIAELPLTRMHEECVNPGGLSDDDTLILAIKSGRRT